ncbi:MAG: bifunctional riboflavin kinase/FAD synthetase [Candidatus Omnitrophica bacterium]|nr:bifunctional riboflavin kinase/FAD synthetase [Candidatus Omnitrophota bacterium]
MKRIKFNKNKKGIFLSIGNFDGVHLGHQKILKELLKKAVNKDVEKAVLTFYPHPVKVLSPKKTPHLLTSLRHKMNMLFDIGIDNVYVLEFNKKLSKITPDDFIEHVVKDRLNVSELFVGENFAIGDKEKGNIKKIEQSFKENGIKVNVIKNRKIKGKSVSSTRIRENVLAGKIKEAEKLLGKKYSILGTVIRGEGIGRKIGFPTANIEPYNEIIPLLGVYIVKVLLNEKWYKGLVNIGYRPTVKGKKKTIEVHILNFENDIYGKDIEIFFLKRLRMEKHFKHIDNLRIQIKKDIKKALAFNDTVPFRD